VTSSPDLLVKAAQRLRSAVDQLQFSPPVAHVYNPLDYAFAAHELYLRRFGAGPKKVIFLGMNPGPFGMMQTGVPFGEIAAVRDWLGIHLSITPPTKSHPRRPIEGFDCPRSEVSGRRLWGLFAERFGTAERFFQSHFVANYCPLAFLSDSGANVTPDKLPAREFQALCAACDDHLRAIVKVLEPEWLIGIGGFAEKRAKEALPATIKVGRILHPSPASPAANRGWAAQATRELVQLGVWPPQALQQSKAVGDS
jgi:single-strand selective monofunctional uracil DNA glycosylase